MTETTAPLTTVEADYLAINFISKGWLEHELSLFATKWFDYRQLNMVEATEQYVHAYTAVYRRQYARSIDATRAEHLKPLPIDNPMAHFNDPKMRNKLVGCWRGRQMADALGMPYEVFIEQAMSFRLRFWQRAYLPRPEQLYDERDLERIVEKWEEIQKGQLHYSTLPVYTGERYCGAAHQNDHHEWLWKQASLRSNPRVFLARFIAEQLLPLEKVLSRLPADFHEELFRELEQAKQFSL